MYFTLCVVFYSVVSMTMFPIFACGMLGLFYLATEFGNPLNMLAGSRRKRWSPPSLVEVMKNPMSLDALNSAKPFTATQEEMESFFEHGEIGEFRKIFEEVSDGKKTFGENQLRFYVFALNPRATEAEITECVVQMLFEASESTIVINTDLTFEMFLRALYRAHYEHAHEAEAAPSVFAAFAHDLQARNKKKSGQK